VLSALSTGHKTVILVVAAVFIVFALCSSFVFSRMSSNFPGRRIALFVAACVLLTAAMLGAIIAFASEPPEAGAKAEERAAAQESTGTEPTTGTEPAKPAAPAGDAAAGKALFASQGCSACHTFEPAGSTAKVGPDLDDLAANAKTANRGSVQEYAAESIEDPGAYVVPGYPNGVMPQFQLSETQVADLVAFIAGRSD
jgi:mono/diheme cytochrome c family protein